MLPRRMAELLGRPWWDRLTRRTLIDRSPAHRVLLAFLVGVLAAVFLLAGVTKLAGLEMHREDFARWGYPLWFMYAVGGFETSAALLLLVPRARFGTGAALIVEMVGAAFTHVAAAEFRQLAAPFSMVLLAGLVMWLERPDILRARIATPWGGHYYRSPFRTSKSE